MPNTIGEIAARMVIDDESAIQKLRQVNALSAITQKTFQELAAEGKRLSASLQTLGQGDLGQPQIALVAKTWKEFVGERMGSYMKQFGSHGAAIKQIAKEWEVYKASLQGTEVALKSTTAAIGTEAQAAKSFTVTINRQTSEQEISTAATRESEAAAERYRQELMRLAEVRRDEINLTKASGQATQTTVTEESSAIMREIGIVEQLQVNLRDLALAREAATDPAQVAQLNAEYATTKQRLDEVTNRGLGGMRTEMRRSREEINRGSQALFGLVFLLNTIDGSAATGEMGKIRASITQSAQAAIGLVFTLQLMGGAAAGMALPIGIAVGAITLITSLISAQNKVAQEAADEGLKEYTDLLEKIPRESLPVVRFDVKSEIARVKTELGSLHETIRGRGSLVGDEEKRAIIIARDRVAILETELERLEARLETTSDTIEAERVLAQERATTERVTQERLPVIEAINTRIAKLKEEQLTIDKDMPGAMGMIQEKSNQIAAAQKELADATRTTTEQFEDQIAFEEKLLSLNMESVDQMEESLKLMQSQTDDEELKLDIQTKINGLTGLRMGLLQEELRAGRLTNEQYEERLRSLSRTTNQLKDQIAISSELARLGQEGISITESRIALGETQTEDLINELVQLYAITDEQGKQVLSEKELLGIRVKILELQKAQEEAEKKRTEEVEKAALVGIANLTDRALAEEDLRHKTALKNLDERVKVEQEAGTLTAERQRGYDSLRLSENMKNEDTLFNIRTQHEQGLADLRIALIPTEEGQIRARFDEDMKRLQELHNRKVLNDVEFDLQKRNLEKETNDQLIDLDQKRFVEMISALDMVGNVLHRAFNTGGDDLIQKMLGALQIAMQIAKTMQAMSAGTMSGPAGFLGIFGSLLGFAALAEGGKIPDGSYVVNEKQSAKHADLLDALGASTIRGGEPHKDSVPAKTAGGKNVLLTPGERVLPPELAMIAEALNRGEISEERSVMLADIFSQEGSKSPSSTGDRALMETLRKLMSTSPLKISPLAFATGGQVSTGSNMRKRSASLSELVSINARGSLVDFSRSTTGFRDIKYAGPDLSPLISEIRGLRQDNVLLRQAITAIELSASGPLEVKGSVDISNGEMFLRKEMPNYEDFRTKKVID